MEGDIITTQDVFLFDYSAGIDENGKFKGHLESMGLRPRFLERLQRPRRQGRPGSLRPRAAAA